MSRPMMALLRGAMDRARQLYRRFRSDTAVDDIIDRLQLDELTGLPTRYIFNRELPLMLGRAVRNNGALIVAVIDLNLLKWINDKLGHPAGDSHLQHFVMALNEVMFHACSAGHEREPHCCHRPELYPQLSANAQYELSYEEYTDLLQAASQAGRLCIEDVSEACSQVHQLQRLCPLHLVARVGGDEVMVVVARPNVTAEEAADSAKDLGQTIFNAIEGMNHFIRKPDVADELNPGDDDADELGADETNSDAIIATTTISFAIGLAFTTSPETNLPLLLNYADQAMYRAKRNDKEDEQPGPVVADSSFRRELDRAGRYDFMRHRAINDRNRRRTRIQPAIDLDGRIKAGIVRTLPMLEWDRLAATDVIPKDLGLEYHAARLILRDVLVWLTQAARVQPDLPPLYAPISASFIERNLLELLQLLKDYPVATEKLFLVISGLTTDAPDATERRLAALNSRESPGDRLVAGLALDIHTDKGGRDGGALTRYFRHLNAVLINPQLLGARSLSGNGNGLGVVTLRRLFAEIRLAEAQSARTILTGIDDQGLEELVAKVRNTILPEQMSGDPLADLIPANGFRQSRLAAGAYFGPPLPPSEYLRAVMQGQRYPVTQVPEAEQVTHVLRAYTDGHQGWPAIPVQGGAPTAKDAAPGE